MAYPEQERCTSSIGNFYHHPIPWLFGAKNILFICPNSLCHLTCKPLCCLRFLPKQTQRVLCEFKVNNFSSSLAVSRSINLCSTADMHKGALDFTLYSNCDSCNSFTRPANWLILQHLKGYYSLQRFKYRMSDV